MPVRTSEFPQNMLYACSQRLVRRDEIWHDAPLREDENFQGSHPHPQAGAQQGQFFDVRYIA